MKRSLLCVGLSSRVAHYPNHVAVRFWLPICSNLLLDMLSIRLSHFFISGGIYRVSRLPCLTTSV